MHIDIDKIRMMAGDTKNYSNGVKYYQNDRVRITQIEDDLPHGEIAYYGKAYGSKVYEFQIVDMGRKISYDCSCPASRSYDRACKHVVAALLEINFNGEKLMEELTGKNKEESIAGSITIIDVLEDALESFEPEDENREKIKIEYHLKSGNFNSYFELKMKIGLNKMFVLKDFCDFYEGYSNEMPFIEINNSLTIEPENHVLTKRDRENFDNLYKLFQFVGDVNYDYPPRTINLKESMLNRFLDGFKGELYINDNLFEVVDSSEVDIVIRDDETYVIGSLKFLDETMEYGVVGSKMFRIPPKYRKYYAALSVCREEDVREKDRERVNSLMKELIVKSGMDIPSYAEERCKPKLTVEGDENGLSMKLEVVNHKEIDGKRYYLKPDKEAFDKLHGLLPRDMANDLFQTGEATVRGSKKTRGYLIEVMPLLEDAYEVEQSARIPRYEKLSGDLMGEIYEKADRLELSLGIEGVTPDELQVIFDNIAKGSRYIEISDGRIFQADSELRRKIEELSREGIIPQHGGVELSGFEAMRLSLVNPDIKSPLKDSLKKLIESDDKNIFLPKLESTTLRNYQRDGYIWMKKMYEGELGGILADDMGLGKTLQTIALLTGLYTAQMKKPSLIVVPTSLLHNWRKEFEKFSPALGILIVEGTKGVRKKILEDNNLDGKILITTYGTLKNDIDSYKNIDYEVVILDEAQNIKSSATLTSKAVKLLNGRVRYALTGTPIENNIYELWSLFDFILPGYLGKREKFKRSYGNVITNGEGAEALKSLQRIIKPFVLRRMKKDVLKELPPKIETDIVVELDKTQKKCYLSYLEKFKEEAGEIIKKEGFNKSRVKILALLTRLRQICCSPEMFIEDYKGKSSKVDTLLELLREMKESGHRVLIFSQFTRSFDVITGRLDSEGFDYYTIDGRVKSQERMRMCEEFNRGKGDLFLISLKAGGTGLNLTGADVVIHFDPWWNPAVENQATDRSHRMGQKKSVQVIRLIAEDTVEEKVIDIQNRKKKLIENMVDGEGRLESLKKEDIQEILEI